MTSCVALGPSGNWQGSVKCFDIETGKLLYCCIMTQILWSKDDHLIQKVESWEKRGLRAIKRGCIKFLYRVGKTFDWDNNDLLDLEVVDDQTKLTDLGVANIPEIHRDV